MMELADIHCHLMPYVDDGAYDMEESEALLRTEAEQGVRTRRSRGVLNRCRS